MPWKIEIFPDVNNPKRLDIQVLATAEDMPTAEEVAGWLNWNELVEMFILMDQGCHKPEPSNELLAHTPAWRSLPQPTLEDLHKKYNY